MFPSSLELDALTEAQFEEISHLVKSLAGINLHTGKKELVKARLSKRLRTLGLTNFDEYIAVVRDDTTGTELVTMLDALSTNLTKFFREPDHFQYLAEKVIRPLAAQGSGKLRIWSAGCSTGEEPYTLAITVADALPNLARWDIRVLATDLSTRVLARAARGVYDAERVEGVPPEQRSRHFVQVGNRPAKEYQVNERLRSLVHFARLNLMGPWPMRGPFQAIFCRNVMIYFDKPTQATLIERFYDLLAPGGTLCVGHSESLAAVKHKFHYVQPTIYEKS
jgi:chemotaxis protein methyltransferase CheR